MSKVSPEEAVSRLDHLLREEVAVWTEIITSYRGMPLPTSAAEQDRGLQQTLGGEWGEDPIDQAIKQAETLSMVAHDQVVGLLSLLDEQSLYAPITIARASCEAYARMWWLLDPDIDIRARVARGMNERLDGLESSRALPDYVRQGFDPRGRIEAIKRAAGENGYELLREGRRWWIKERRPSATRLFRLMFDTGPAKTGQPIFWILSAVAHGTIGRWVQLMKAPIEGVALSAAAVAFSSIRAVDRQTAYMGWKHAEWLKWRNASRDFILKQFGPS